MKPTPIALVVAGLLAAGAAQAQTTTVYTEAHQTYQQQQAAYEAQQSAYEAARLKYENDRAAYDARWGAGAYARLHGPFVYTPPAYTYGYGSTAATTYPYSTAPYVYPGVPAATYPYTTSPYASTYPYSSTYPYTTAPYAGGYSVNASYGVATPCVGATGGLNMGALSVAANAALAGKTLSGTTEVNRAVLGAVVDHALGARSIASSQCDANGYFYTFEQTQPYREGYYDAQGRWVVGVTGAYANCRLAPAPTDATASTWRFVKVCPDASGRFRISA
ncbi:MAG TPA: hypothetical protein VD906_02490 [Caulobacteraceae bacterium]|nr:hypothetical protein [Caulobacteraceae bacterium]